MAFSHLANILAEFPTLDLKCFAYAPPCVLDLHSAVASQSFISSYILDTDVVPRLSYGSLDRLRHLTLKIMERTDSNAQRIVQALAAGSLSKGLSDRISSWVNVEQQELDVTDLHRDVNTLEDKLFPAGQVYHIMSADASSEDEFFAEKDLFQMEISNPTFFADIIISNTMFSNHMPNAYNKAFRGVQRLGILHRARLKAALTDMGEAPFAPLPASEKRSNRPRKSHWGAAVGTKSNSSAPFVYPPPPDAAPQPPAMASPPSDPAQPATSDRPLKLSTSDGEFVILHDTSEL